MLGVKPTPITFGEMTSGKLCNFLRLRFFVCQPSILPISWVCVVKGKYVGESSL